MMVHNPEVGDVKTVPKSVCVCRVVVWSALCARSDYPRRARVAWVTVMRWRVRCVEKYIQEVCRSQAVPVTELSAWLRMVSPLRFKFNERKNWLW